MSAGAAVEVRSAPIIDALTTIAGEVYQVSRGIQPGTISVMVSTPAGMMTLPVSAKLGSSLLVGTRVVVAVGVELS